MSLAGVGLSLEQRQHNSAILVKEVLAGGPAANSGQIFGGDEIVAVDGCNIRATNPMIVRDLIVGPIGSTVIIGVEREIPGSSAKQVLTVTLARGPAIPPSSPVASAQQQPQQQQQQQFSPVSVDVKNKSENNNNNNQKDEDERYNISPTLRSPDGDRDRMMEFHHRASSPLPPLNLNHDSPAAAATAAKKDGEKGDEKEVKKDAVDRSWRQDEATKEIILKDGSRVPPSPPSVVAAPGNMADIFNPLQSLFPDTSVSRSSSLNNNNNNGNSTLIRNSSNSSNISARSPSVYSPPMGRSSRNEGSSFVGTTPGDAIRALAEEALMLSGELNSSGISNNRVDGALSLLLLPSVSLLTTPTRRNRNAEEKNNNNDNEATGTEATSPLLDRTFENETKDLEPPVIETTDQSFSKLSTMSLMFKDMKERFSQAVERHALLAAEEREKREKAESKMREMELRILELQSKLDEREKNDEVVEAERRFDNVLDQLGREEERRRGVEAKLETTLLALALANKELSELKEAFFLGKHGDGAKIPMPSLLDGEKRRQEAEATILVETLRTDRSFLESENARLKNNVAGADETRGEIEKLRSALEAQIFQTNQAQKNEARLRSQLEDERRAWREALSKNLGGKDDNSEANGGAGGNSNSGGGGGVNYPRLSSKEREALLEELQEERVARKDAEDRARKLLSELKRRIVTYSSTSSPLPKQSGDGGDDEENKDNNAILLSMFSPLAAAGRSSPLLEKDLERMRQGVPEKRDADFKKISSSAYSPLPMGTGSSSTTTTKKTNIDTQAMDVDPESKKLLFMSPTPSRGTMMEGRSLSPPTIVDAGNGDGASAATTTQDNSAKKATTITGRYTIGGSSSNNYSSPSPFSAREGGGGNNEEIRPSILSTPKRENATQSQTLVMSPSLQASLAILKKHSMGSNTAGGL